MTFTRPPRRKPQVRASQAPVPWGRQRRAPLVRLLERRRRTLAAAALCAGVAVAVYQLTPPSAALASVVVAAADLPAGAPLQNSQLRLARVPVDVLPERAATEVGAVAGQRLAGPVRRGEILTVAALVGPGLLAGASPGTVAVPVRIADPGSLELVRTGQVVDLVLSDQAGADGQRSTILATGVTILWTGAGGAPPGGWLGTPKDTEGLVVVAAESERARAIAGASTRGKVFFVLVDRARP
ncbi:RcpC/CpaB family pilus assembly protein [Sinomonas sp. ASV322]|uniref:RcpC/CpaB family pilus assembly protein n=1 Tax=Sinomonas sp. ASV322 TaxID=3041920 RepID=UPI0027DD05D1|nr:RcpC/CpaB family pilus assembly protein [Sinomonas sp. ASV322]MDQ4501953.1 RcpC/CpaB family pilus assembly protein [Sinomonas sp. ASV322]